MHYKPTNILLTALVLSMALGGLTNSSMAQEAKLDDILSRLEKRYGSTEAFSHHFDQIKSLQQLTEPMRFSGTLVFRKPHFIRMEVRGEENFNLFVNGESIWLEDLDFGEVEQFDFSEIMGNNRLNRLVPPFFIKDFSEIKETFQIWLDESSNQDVLEFIPTDKSPSSIRRIRLAVDKFSRILWMRVDYTNDDWTDTRFSGWKTMPKISEHYFSYQKKK
jgi:outer membrane lipoprotein-sorting protein